MTKRLMGILVALIALTGAAPSRADALKESIYVLGVHIGNANGVLFGLVNSYRTNKEAHPNAEPLIRRQIKWTKELAESLGLKTDDLVKLDKDLSRLSFGEMKYGIERIIERLRSDVGRKFKSTAWSVFNLGVQITLVQGAITLALNSLPRHREARRSSVVSAVADAGNNITENRLETNATLLGDLVRAAGSGTFDKIAKAADAAAAGWQSDFGAAKGWALAPGTPVPAGLRTPPPVKPVPKTVLVPTQAVPTHTNTPAGPANKQPAPTRSAGSFGGTWTTNWGDMTLSQSGSQVSGSYSHSQGSLSGTVSGSVLRFRWYQKGNGNKGSGRFVLSSDGRSFSGSWSYTDDPDKNGRSWTGSRK